MNCIFSVIWNHSCNAFVVVSELATRRGKRSEVGAIQVDDHSTPCNGALKPLPFAIALISCSIFCMPVVSIAADLPTGGHVVLGSGQIGTAANHQLTINQSSQKMAMDWQSFDIGKDNKVTFVQPGADSIALNRVIGADGSKIIGQLNANGRVFLINPNGVLFGQGASVSVGGLVASTLTLSNRDFANGKYALKGDGGNASVVNQGTITAADGGAVALLGGTVSNQGVIVAKLGTVALAAGKAVTLDFAGDGLLNVQVDEAAKNALAENRQLIQADGGQVIMTAAASNALLRTVVNNTGVIEARGLQHKNGKISLGGGDSGLAHIAGTLDVSATQGTGGAIQITGQNIALASATLNASGASGGGGIKIGGEAQGKGTLAHAQGTSVDAGSSLKADAGTTGKGGDIVVWSDGTTVARGNFSARGGTHSGDGGSVETSGHSVDFTGIQVSTSATKGKTGDWLVDPEDLIVDDVSAATINAALLNTDVTLQTTGTTASTTGGSAASTATGPGDISVNSALSWSSPNTLTLDSFHSIAINANVSVTGAGGLVLVTNNNRNGASSGSGDLSFADGVSASFTAPQGSGQRLNINGSAYTLVYSMADIDGIDGDPASSSAITNQTAAGGLAGHYALARNQDASGVTYTNAIVGSYDNDDDSPFSGTFEGLGHTLSNLTITAPYANYTGLFGYNQWATVRDLGLVNGAISGGSYVGGIVSMNDSFSSILNSYFSGTVSTSSSGIMIGGIAGLNGYRSTIANSYSMGTVTGTRWTGGITGYNGSALVTNSHSSSNVNGGTGDYVGGVVGANESATITNSYSTGTVSGNTRVGGVAGNSYQGTISNSYNTGNISGDSFVGGVVGLNDTSSSLTNSYNFGNVQADNIVGGVAGYNDSAVSSSYSTGQVRGTAGINVGGAIGYNQAAGTVTHVYWNSVTSGNAVGIGGGVASGVTGLTTAQLQGVLPSDFDNTVWATASGLYPYLTSHYPHGTPQAISGFAQNSDAAGQVATVINGAVAGTSSIGADGYYYSLLAPGALANTNVFTYAQSGGNLANTFTQGVTDTTSNINLTANTLVLIGDENSLSSLLTDLNAASGGVDSANKLFTLDGGGLNATDDVLLTQAGSFIVDQSLSAVGSSTLSVAGDLTIAQGGHVSGSDVVLSTPGAFINNAGSNAVTASAVAGHHWVIYSNTPTTDTFAGLNSNNTAIWNANMNTLPASAVIGNRYVFRYQPTVTYTAANVSKTYGDQVDVSSAYTTSGVSAGVAGAFAADTLANVVAGTLAMSSMGTAATANVGSYAIQEIQNTLSGLGGYLVALANTGNVIVNARHITVAANSGGSTYGDAIPDKPGIGVTGLVNGDLDSGLGLSNDFAITSADNAGSNVLHVVGTLSNGNYVIDQRINGSWTVNARHITVAANSGSSTYGDVTPDKPGISVTGLVNGDLDSGLGLSNDFAITSADNAGSNVLHVVGTLSNGNYVIDQRINGSWTVNARNITVAVNSGSSTYGATHVQPTLSASGLVNGQGVSVLTGLSSTGISDTTHVGTYVLSVQGVLANGNYTVTQTSDGQWTVDPRALVVTANNLGKIVNASDPALTWTTNGNLVNGDHLNGNLTRSAGETVGQYRIEQGTLNNSNYAIAFTDGVFNIGVTPLNPLPSPPENVAAAPTTPLHELPSPPTSLEVLLQLLSAPENVAAATTKPLRKLPTPTTPLAVQLPSDNLYSVIEQGLRLPEGL
ncbi:MBG domain-containing protein [Sodalis sp. RH20]|uniref:two-partner secretion domain-containing protein n=1 Tax=unclassified Sodalis (in: enterobacteria) TaxID=2636512 RepID=UPI0039B54E77